jgi:chaperone required for assembly of F1-ATPase
MSADPVGGGDDPVARVRAAAQGRALPKRFYEAVTAEARGAGYAVHLDRRPLRTPGKLVLVLPTMALAEAIAAEWSAQEVHIDPQSMPLTRLANSVRDQVDGREVEVRADIVKYAGSDLVCYRAASPEGLVTAQAAAWDPIVAWARETLGADLVVCSGLMPISQSAASRVAIEEAVAPLAGFSLAAAHVMTTLLGSVVLALAVLRARVTPEEAWRAAHVDDDWQIAKWGPDAEAAARQQRRHSEFMAAVRTFALAAEAN